MQNWNVPAALVVIQQWLPRNWLQPPCLQLKNFTQTGFGTGIVSPTALNFPVF